MCEECSTFRTGWWRFISMHVIGVSVCIGKPCCTFWFTNGINKDGTEHTFDEGVSYIG